EPAPLISRQSAVREASVGLPLERVQGREAPGSSRRRLDPEGGSLLVGPAHGGNSEQGSTGPEEQTTGRSRRAVGTASEWVDDPEPPRARPILLQLIDGAQSVGASGRGHPVEA